MQEQENQYELTLLDEELHRLIGAVPQIPYIALPPEKPEIICFAEKIKELTGYDANEILVDREHWANMVHPDDWERVDAAFTQCKNEGIPFDIEYRLIHKDGSLRYVIDKGEPIFDGKGEITQIEGLITPIGQSSKPENIPLSEITQVTRFGNVDSSVFEKV